MRSHRFLFLFPVLLAVFFASIAPYTPKARAAPNDKPVIIRDTEIENTFKEWLTPLLNAAKIPPQNVNFILVQSPQVNAFVAGGSNIFVYTGLIDKSENPDEILGVLAHEIGHISGGHLIGRRDALERASYESILGTVLGIGAAIAGKNGALASAIISGTNNIAARRYLAHSRVNESSADQAALKFLNEAQFNPKGLKTFFQKLESEELLPTDRQSAYVRTHPLTHDRIDAISESIKTSPYLEKSLPPEWIEQHKRMKAKLLGFSDPGSVPWVYHDNDTSIPARYAKAIADYRQSNIDRALSGIDSLLSLEPNNPYFKELKGQMLVEFGRIDEAIPYYRDALNAPAPTLIQVALARALVERDSKSGTLNEAISLLKQALHTEQRSPDIYRLLATAYGRLGQEDIAKLYLAEEALLKRNFPYARDLTKEAMASFKPDSPEAIRAQDLLAQIDQLETKQDR